MMAFAKDLLSHEMEEMSLVDSSKSVYEQVIYFHSY